MLVDNTRVPVAKISPPTIIVCKVPIEFIVVCPVITLKVSHINCPTILLAIIQLINGEDITLTLSWLMIEI